MVLRSGKNTKGYPKNDELYTAKYIFDALNCWFDLDVCAPKEGPLHTPTNKWFSLEDDGLAQEWTGFIWMNPPYSKPSEWVDKWLAHKNGIACLPLNGNGKWVRSLWNSEAFAILMPPNVPFINREGISKLSWYAISLWGIGDNAKEILNNCGFGRVREWESKN